MIASTLQEHPPTVADLQSELERARACTRALQDQASALETENSQLRAILHELSARARQALRNGTQGGVMFAAAGTPEASHSLGAR